MTSKGLKALDKLRFAVSIAQDLPYKECNELCDTIKQALERLEEYEKLSNCYEVAECYNGVRFIKCPLEQELDKVKQENQELKEQLKLTETARQLLYNELKCCNGISEYAQKLEKAIEIIEKWRRSQLYDLIDSLKSQDIEDYKILEEIIFGEVLE